MKKYLFTLISLLSFGVLLHAQETVQTKAKPAVILDGILMVNGIDTLNKMDRNTFESVTILKEKDKTAQFGINNDNGLLIVITKANKNSPENIAIKNKIAKLNIATRPDALMANSNTVKPSKDSIPNGIFDFVTIEKQPQFPGGLKAFYEYLGQTVRYPKEAQKNRTQGKVFLSFIVEKDGQLSHVEIIRGVSNDINEEAIRVVSGSPKWNPGIQFGVPVRVKYNININFNLN